MIAFLARVKNLLYRLIHFPLIDIFIKEHSILMLELFYGGKFWRLRESCVRKPTHRKKVLYFSTLRRYGSWIGLDATFDSTPVLPHSLYGLFISN